MLYPLLFKKNTLDVFFEQKNVNFAAYADDNTPYFFDKNLELILQKASDMCTKITQSL